MFGLKRVGKNRPPLQLRWHARACLRVLQPRCGNKLEKEAADLEKAAVAARKRSKTLAAQTTAALEKEAADLEKAAVAAKRKQAATLEGCVHLGKVKQMRIDPRWWVRGVHQIVLGVGTAWKGKGASKGSGKGKGAGAAVAERYPKAKTKGKKW